MKISSFHIALAGDPSYQMLELQLAMFIEFPRDMNPGIFVAASDILVVFNSEGDWSFTKPGFTALAHHLQFIFIWYDPWCICSQ